MFYTNEDVLKIRRGTSLKKIKTWNSKIINYIMKNIRNNKLLIVSMSAFIIFSIVNALMICTFFKILQTL